MKLNTLSQIATAPNTIANIQKIAQGFPKVGNDSAAGAEYASYMADSFARNDVAVNINNNHRPISVNINNSHRPAGQDKVSVKRDCNPVAVNINNSHRPVKGSNVAVNINNSHRPLGGDVFSVNNLL